MNFAVKTAFGERFVSKRLLSATIFCYNNDMKTDIVAEIRKFNRAYTAVIGILNGTYLDSGITLTEIRTLYEIMRIDGCTAKDVGTRLRLDAGYMSRVVGRLCASGLVTRTRSQSDGRAYELSLTAEGLAAVGRLNEKSDDMISALISDVSERRRDELVAAMRSISEILGLED